ncbi:hypothetical protein BSL82_10080 [Tardibacter chloracetimidivorans]|uniref:Uncharacterized protein n=1 Tax=Tardibacter chloracetimidivorans TaxID=1921510 RepID=A0A1L3ZVG5_9SPHN|nr:hypothetical protein [Tardibacter chloracetimidivorans]API59621.1 hypothetical protein BSL82_10080 [Tardibacter chloracetimidivorans]
MATSSGKLHRDVLARARGIASTRGCAAELELVGKHPKVVITRAGALVAKVPFAGSPKDADQTIKMLSRDIRRVLEAA